MGFDLDPTQTLGTAMVVLFLGSFALARIPFLRENDIPIPVVGGILFAFVTSVLFLGSGVGVSFDMELKQPLMLAFFTSIGLGADLRMLARGGPQLVVFAAICAAYLIVQNTLGVLTAVALDLHPLVGLLGSSITLSGGHGTGAAYAQQFSDARNLAGAMELAMACATFGLVIGGLLGGPVAGRLIRRHRLAPSGLCDVDEPEAAPDESPIDDESLLRSLFFFVVCLAGGAVVSEWLQDAAFTLPGFVWCLFIGVTIRNLGHLSPLLRVHVPTVEALGGISLSLFLAMALMSLKLWELAGLAGPLLLLMMVQTLCMMLFATFVTWRFVGRDYDAAVIAGGHCGFGMGATPTAVANMHALTRRFGPAPQAFLVVPLMGAFFIDLLNAIVIQGFLTLPVFGG